MLVNKLTKEQIEKLKPLQTFANQIVDFSGDDINWRQVNITIGTDYGWVTYQTNGDVILRTNDEENIVASLIQLNTLTAYGRMNNVCKNKRFWREYRNID